MNVAKTLAAGAGIGGVTYLGLRHYHLVNKGLPLDTFNSVEALKTACGVGAAVMFLRHPVTIARYLGGAYARAMAAQPAATGIATTGVSYSIGEFIAQKIAIARGERDHVDWKFFSSSIGHSWNLRVVDLEPSLKSPHPFSSVRIP